MHKLLSFLNWNVRVGSLFGIPIHLHISLLFFLYPVLYRSGLGVWLGLEFSVLMVLCILLHELGHALTAKHFRLKGLLIMLHGFGGYAASSGDRTPRESLLITLAGPAVTFAVGGLCWGAGSLAMGRFELGSDAYRQAVLFQYLGVVNLWLGVFNLLPSLPFDGGNAVKALLWFKQPERKAIRGAGHIGLVAAPLLAVYGILASNSLAVIFGLMGTITSYMTLRDSGGVNFREAAQDRKERKELEEVKRREAERRTIYLDDVLARQREREEQERLRKLLE